MKTSPERIQRTQTTTGCARDPTCTATQLLNFTDLFIIKGTSRIYYQCINREVWNFTGKRVTCSSIKQKRGASSLLTFPYQLEHLSAIHQSPAGILSRPLCFCLCCGNARAPGVCQDTLHSLNPAQEPSVLTRQKKSRQINTSTLNCSFVLASAMLPLWRKAARAQALKADIISSEHGSRQRAFPV